MFDGAQAAGVSVSQRTVSITSQSGKRVHPRIQLPIIVEIDGCRFHGQDWSLGGCGLSNDGPCADRGDIFKVKLRFAFGGFDIVVDVTARAAWTEGKIARGFQFISLTEEQARVLDYVADCWLRGDLGTLDQLVGRDGRVPKITPVAESSRRIKQIITAFKLGGMLLAGGIVLGVGGFYILSLILTVHSDYAAVSSALTQIRAPEDGYMVASPLRVGSQVKRGMPVATLKPVAPPQTTTWYDTQIGMLETQLGELKSSLVSAVSGFRNFKSVAEADARSTAEARELLEHQIEVEEGVVAQVRALAKEGAIGREVADQETMKLIALQGQLATAKAAEALAVQHLNDAHKGLFPSDGRSTQKSPDDIKHLIADAQAQIVQLQQSKDAATNPLAVESPCDCVVMEIEANAGEFVAANNPIVGLAHDPEVTTEIDALVLSSRVNLIQNGQTARVYLSDRKKGVIGRVVAINYDPANTGRIGLPNTLRTLDNYGLVTVAIDPAQSQHPREPTGVPAIVNFPVDLGMLVRNVTGLTWLMGSDEAKPLARLTAAVGRASP